MKTLLIAAISLIFLNSCVFESPFESEARIPVNPTLCGRWVQQVPENNKGTAERMLVLQHSANEYTVQYPVGEKAMFFRACGVELEGGGYVQIQLIGTAEGPVKAEARKYHLLKVSVDGDAMEIRTIAPDVLGKELGDSARMKAAFAEHKDDPKLFGEPVKFRRVK